MSNQIAKIILEQLGGHKFIVMTGSKKLVAGEKSLSMKLSRNKSGANYLRITHNSMDLYDVEFISIRAGKKTTKHEFNDVYNCMLVNIFEKTTGLYTRLF